MEEGYLGPLNGRRATGETSKETATESMPIFTHAPAPPTSGFCTTTTDAIISKIITGQSFGSRD